MPSLYVDVKKLVGTETPAKKLIALLMRGEGGKKQQLLVVSIVGVGGLGKNKPCPFSVPKNQRTVSVSSFCFSLLEARNK